MGNEFRYGGIKLNIISCKEKYIDTDKYLIVEIEYKGRIFKGELVEG